MITSDYHVHSNFSSDGKASMEQMLDEAIRIGLKKLCFTDHMDYDYPAVSEYNFIFDIPSYMEKLNELKIKYRDRIELLTGVELGLQPHLKEQLSSLIDHNSFDFIIGSSHVVDHMDPYYPDYWEDKTKAQGIARYFESILENCRIIDSFHVYGHLDYIVRYTPDRAMDYTEYPYEKYADLLEEILRTLIAKGKGIEVNTSGYKYNLGHPHPKAEVLKRYRELGGEILTIGSDAHMPQHLCYGFDQTLELLKSVGFRYYTVFQQGKPSFIHL